MTPEAASPDAPPRKFYGRRHGKSLRARQARLMADLLPRFAVPGVARAGLPGRAPIDLAALWPSPRPVWLEIGFGGGEHLIHQARLRPDVGLIGCEPFVNGVAQCLAQIEEAGVENVRLHPADARDLIDLLPDASIDRAFLLYPDPWPKTRHWDRRFASPENLAALARVLRPGAVLRLATDISDYLRHALRAAETTGAYAVEGAPESWSTPWEDWVPTRFERRARREGRGSSYVAFRRL